MERGSGGNVETVARKRSVLFSLSLISSLLHLPVSITVSFWLELQLPFFLIFSSLFSLSKSLFFSLHHLPLHVWSSLDSLYWSPSGSPPLFFHLCHSFLCLLRFSFPSALPLILCVSSTTCFTPPSLFFCFILQLLRCRLHFLQFFLVFLQFLILVIKSFLGPVRLLSLHLFLYPCHIYFICFCFLYPLQLFFPLSFSYFVLPSVFFF